MVQLSRKLLTAVRPYRAHALLVLLTQVPSVAFLTVQPLLLRGLIDDAIGAGNGRLAFLLIAAMVGLLVANALGDLAQHYLVARYGTNAMNDLRLRIFRRLQDLSVGYHARAQAGDLMSRFTSDLDAVEHFLMIEFPSAVSIVLTIGFGALVLIGVEWRLALLVLALVPMIHLIERVLSPRADEASERRQQDLAGVAGTMHEILSAQLVVKTLGLQDRMIGRFRGDLDRFARSATRAGLLNGILAATLTASSYLLLALSMGVGTYMTLRGQLSVGSLIAFFELVWFIVTAVEELSNVVPPFQQAAAGMHRISDLLDETPEVVDAADARPLPPFSQAIRLDDVSFGYGDGQQTLAGVSVTIPARGSVAIVGPSGCGKSTMLGLLMRLYDPTQGSVTFDGHDLREVTQASLRAQIGAVLQESILFDTTVRENIRLGRPEATDAEVEAAARAAEVHQFLASLPLGYDTMVGERGGRLSGGQRQRIALARAMIRRPRILVLDEPTSALDADTEAAVNATLRRLGEDHTVVSVTHRLASVVEADHIIVMERGRVIEQGTHDQLLTLQGAYHRAWQRQSGFVISADGRRASVEPARLRAIPLFEHLDDAQLRALADRFITERYQEDEVVFAEGDPGDRLHIIVRGRVQVLAGGADGHPRQVAVLEDGDFFGEIALLHDVRRTATIRTRTPCLFLALERDQFLGLLRTFPELRCVFERAADARQHELASLRQASERGEDDAPAPSRA
jgi:ATP-binding cassette subfamily B protein